MVTNVFCATGKAYQTHLDAAKRIHKEIGGGDVKNMKIIVSNISGGIRKETVNGRDYFVAPMVLIVEGVLNGSKGPLMYPVAELEATADMWNGMPIVAPGHPKLNDRHVSARHPEVLRRYGVGNIYNARVDGNKLVGEGWFDVEATKRVDVRLHDMLANNKPIELSTGLQTHDQMAPGTFNGTPYRAVARRHRPDHLAILLDERGACSLPDGCGVLVNKKKPPSKKLGMSSSKACKILKDGSVNGHPLTDAQKGMFGAKCGETRNSCGGCNVDKKELVNWLVANCSCYKDSDRSGLEALSDETLKGMKQREEERVKPVAAPAPQTYNSLQDWYNDPNSAPPWVKTIVHNGLQAEREQKQALVNKLIAHLPVEERQLTGNSLMAKSKADLELMVKLIPPAPTSKVQNAAAPSNDPLDDLFGPVDFSGAVGAPALNRETPADGGMLEDEDIDWATPVAK